MIPDHTKNIVEVKNVSYSYFPGTPVIRDIDLNIHKGDYLGVVGPNGGGKSTLIKLILGLIKPQVGNINRSAKTLHMSVKKLQTLTKSFLQLFGM